MKQLLIVFVGGGMGTVMRFLIGKLLPYSGKGFPWSTFCSNLIGCLLIGLLTGYFLRNSGENQSSIILFASIGFCGGFTTFSTFSMEVIQRGLAGEWLNAGLHAMVSMLVCLCACALGYIIARQLVN